MKNNITRAAIPPANQSASGPVSSSVPAKHLPKAKFALRTEVTDRHQSKQDRVLTMLRQNGGVTVAAVAKATGWQTHSVRGFFAGVVRKKLKLNLVSTKINGKRTYRIVTSKRAPAGAAKQKRAS